MKRLKPGTRIRFNEKCSWPERIGCEGVIVDPAVFKGKYPVDHFSRMDMDVGSNYPIVKLDDDDPLVEPGRRHELWTCATSTDALDVLAAAGQHKSAGPSLPESGNGD